MLNTKLLKTKYILFIVTFLQDLPVCMQNPECYGRPESNIMTKYADCLDGSLTDEEVIWSDRIVKAWTNFAIYGYDFEIFFAHIILLNSPLMSATARSTDLGTDPTIVTYLHTYYNSRSFYSFIFLLFNSRWVGWVYSLFKQ